MNFLVILICLLINYLWLKDFDRFDDGWFFSFRCKMQDFSQSIASNASLAWMIGIGLTYLIPLSILSLVIVFLADKFFDLPIMLLHVLVLLVAIDRIQPGKMAKDFLEKWTAGDIEGCKFYVEQQLAVGTSEKIDDEEELSNYFSKQLIYRSFERMFVMFFWYILTGPVGILFCYITYQLRDIQWGAVGEEAFQQTREQPVGESELITTVIQILEWIPLRLVGITFSLTGNFVRCFDNLKSSFWSLGKEKGSDDLLYSYARCALSDLQLSELLNEDEADADEQTQARLLKAAEIRAQLALLERSQAVWLIVLAVVTVYS